MLIDVLTLFPAICEGAFGASMMKRAQEAGAVKFRVRNIRDWSCDKHHTTDDTPYGGGQGMVMKAEPIFAAVRALQQETSHPPKVILLTPQGRVFKQNVAAELARSEHLIFICGHYEGIDQRVSEFLATDEVSIGDYVLTNGAIAAMVIVDAIVRLLPGVLGDAQSAIQDSFNTGQGGLLEGPQYTRPVEFEGHRVPDILLSGNHALIQKWRTEEARRLTQKNRPDLLSESQ